MRPSKWGRRLDGSRRNAVKDAEYNPWKVPTEHRKYGEAQGRSGSGRGSLLCHYLESVTRIAANCHRSRAVVAEHPAMPNSPLTPRLAALNRDQLVALVERLVARHPDLADLAHLPLPGEVKRADGEGVRAHVTRILLTMGDDWRASSRAQYELFPIVAMADDYRNQGLLDDARIVYRAIIDAILAVYERIRDEESEIGGVVGDCIEGLGNCLDATSDSDLRTRLLRDAFEVYAWDTVAHGGYGMDGPPEKLLISRTTAPEKALVAGWIQAALTVPSGRPKYGAQYAGKLMLQLVGDQQDATSRESTYRMAGMDVELVDLLLAQGRTDDELTVVRASGADVVRLADRLVAAGFAGPVAEIVNRHRAVLDYRSDSVRKWLALHGVAEIVALEKLAWALHNFEQSGNVGHWDTLRSQAEALGRLDQVLPHALAAVETERSGYQASRARILGLSGRFDEAEAVLARLPEGAWKRAALVVAVAAEIARPSLARALYARVADDLRRRGTKPAREEILWINERLAALG